MTNIFQKTQSITPATSLHQSTTKIYLGLLQTLHANLEAVRIGTDPEALHDFRVAIRRTRSALSAIPDTFSLEQTEHFRNEFAWIQQITGPTRDLDVHQQALNEHIATLSLDTQAHLAPLRQILAQQRDNAQATMVKHLDSKRFVDLLDAWQVSLKVPEVSEVSIESSLEIPIEESNNVAVTQTTIDHTTTKRLCQLYKRVLNAGNTITRQSPAKQYHELRKKCKKLRYFLEFFKDLYKPKLVNHILRKLKKLLDCLGTHQDLSVQLQNLHTLKTQISSYPELQNSDTQKAFAQLLLTVTKRQTKLQKQALDAFKKINSNKGQHLFTTLLRSNLNNSHTP